MHALTDGTAEMSNDTSSRHHGKSLLFSITFFVVPFGMTADGQTARIYHGCVQSL